MEVLESTVFIIGVMWVIFNVYATFTSTDVEPWMRIPSMLLMACQVVAVVIIIATGSSGFHMLWIIPASYLFGFLFADRRYL